MNPIDYRNATWNDIKANLVEVRLQVLSAMRQHGPCTTRELANKSGIDLLTLRPRVTELHQLGFVVVVEDPAVRQAAALRGYPREGVYKSLSEAEAWDLYKTKVKDANKEVQSSFAL